MIIIFIFLIISYLIYAYLKNNNGYLDGYINNYSSNNALNYEYEILTNKIICKYKDEIIGSMDFIDWNLGNNRLYIGNNLYVSEKYRKNGISKEIIKRMGNRFLQNNSNIAMFSTNYELKCYKLFEIYWVKYKIEEKTDIFRKISWKDINYKYISHPWLLSDSIEKIFRNMKGTRIINIASKNITFGIKTVIDSSGDRVNNVEWYLGDIKNISLLKNFDLENDYIAIPTLKRPYNIWDKEIYYLYGNLNNIEIPKLKDNDKLGWLF